MTRKLLAALSLAAATTLAACVPGGPDGGLNASADPRARMGAQQAGRSGAAPAAMLEAIADAQSAEFDAFDYLDAGQSIALGARGRATIAYFESCRVEQIRGGTVTVGNAESRVAGGQVNARTMACKGTKPVVVAEAREAGGGVSRAFPADRWAEWSLKSGRPIFKWSGGAGAPAHRITVTELEQRPGRVVWTGTARGSYVAYPPSAPVLAPGMPYLVKVEGPSTTAESVFSIDPNLDIADTPASRVVVVGR